MHFCYFITISPWEKEWPFSLINLNPLHLRRLCAKFGWNCQNGSGEEDFSKISLNVFSLFYYYLHWRESFSLLHPRERRRLVLFLKRNLFYSFTLRCECVYYILIWLSAVNIVDYLMYSYQLTKFFNRGRLIWNSNASPKMNSSILISIQGQHQIYMYWHDFERFFHIALCQN